MEEKINYVSLSEVVNDYIQKSNFMDGQTYYNTCMNNLKNDKAEIIITEDIDCEIVEQKKLENN